MIIAEVRVAKGRKHYGEKGPGVFSGRGNVLFLGLGNGYIRVCFMIVHDNVQLYLMHFYICVIYFTFEKFKTEKKRTKECRKKKTGEISKERNWSH